MRPSLIIFSFCLFGIACTEKNSVNFLLRQQAHQVLYRSTLSSHPEVKSQAIYFLHDLKSKSQLDSIFDDKIHSWKSFTPIEPPVFKLAGFHTRLDSLKRIIGSGDLKIKPSVFSLHHTQSREKRWLLCLALAESGSVAHLPLLSDFLYVSNPIINVETLESPQEHPWNLEISNAAAYAIVRITGE